MRLLLKFNILLVAVFGVGLLLIAFAARNFLQRQARAEVIRQAALLISAASATRNYTEQYVTPVLEASENTASFLPQAIPFFASTTTFQQIRQSNPDYNYKEAALNPTNLRDRATDWESDLISYFRNSPGASEIVRERASATGMELYLAHPIRVEAGCMQCHSVPSAAPKALLTRYGSDHGFGWNVDEVIGAQIISVPMSVPAEMARKGLQELLTNLTLVFLLAVLLIDTGLYFIVVRPLQQISQAADRISRGEMELDQQMAQGKDEVAQVARSFQRMHTSLRKALDLLKET